MCELIEESYDKRPSSYTNAENRVRENVQKSFVQICHVDGKKNLADLFTKEMRDTSHFVELRDLMMRPRLSSSC